MRENIFIVPAGESAVNACRDCGCGLLRWISVGGGVDYSAMPRDVREVEWDGGAGWYMQECV